MNSDYQDFIENLNISSPDFWEIDDIPLIGSGGLNNTLEESSLGNQAVMNDGNNNYYYDYQYLNATSEGNLESDISLNEVAGTSGINIKNQLKTRIVEKIKSKGKDLLPFDVTTNANKNKVDTEKERKEKKRKERNKNAASKSREKKKQEYQQLQTEFTILETINKDLKAGIEKLKLDINKCEGIITNHDCLNLNIIARQGHMDQEACSVLPQLNVDSSKNQKSPPWDKNDDVQINKILDDFVEMGLNLKSGCLVYPQSKEIILSDLLKNPYNQTENQFSQQASLSSTQEHPKFYPENQSVANLNNTLIQQNIESQLLISPESPNCSNEYKSKLTYNNPTPEYFMAKDNNLPIVARGKSSQSKTFTNAWATETINQEDENLLKNLFPLDSSEPPPEKKIRLE